MRETPTPMAATGITSVILGEREGCVGTATDTLCFGRNTFGQRAGLGIGGVRGAADQPWYVADKVLDTNTLIVVQGGEHPLLYWRGLRAEQLHWIPAAPPERRLSCTAKTRYRQPDQPCTLELSGAACRVTFETPQRAITPGQSVVFYQDDRCLGGGVITAGIR